MQEDRWPVRYRSSAAFGRDRVHAFVRCRATEEIGLPTGAQTSALGHISVVSRFCSNPGKRPPRGRGRAGWPQSQATERCPQTPPRMNCRRLVRGHHRILRLVLSRAVLPSWARRWLAQPTPHATPRQSLKGPVRCADCVALWIGARLRSDLLRTGRRACAP